MKFLRASLNLLSLLAMVFCAIVPGSTASAINAQGPVITFPLYAVNLLNNKIIKIDKFGVQTEFASGDKLNSPAGVALDGAGNLYIANNGDNKIIKIDSTGAQSVFTSGDKLQNPVDLAFDSSGYLYATSVGNHSIVKIDPNGVQSVYTSGGEISNPYNLVFDNDGNLYVACPYNYKIVKVDINGNQTVFATGGTPYLLNGPGDMAFDSSGNLYVGDLYGSYVTKIDSSGVQTFFAGSGDFNEIKGLAFDSSDNLFISTLAHDGSYNPTQHKIVKVNSSGEWTVFTAGGLLYNSIFIAFQLQESGDLALTTTAAPDPIVAGANITYTLQLANNGMGPADEVVITDTLPANTTLVSVSGGLGWSTSTPPIGGTGTIQSTKASVAAGETATIQIVLAVKDTLASGTLISNTAEVTSTSPDSNPADNTSTSVTTVDTQADLSLALSSGAATAAPGMTFAYSLTYQNSGPSVTQNVVLTEIVPAHTSFYPAASSIGWTCLPGNTSGSVCTYPVAGSVAVSQGGAVSFAVTVVDPIPVGVRNIHNSASIASTSTDPNLANNIAVLEIRNAFDNFIFLPSMIR